MAKTDRLWRGGLALLLGAWTGCSGSSTSTPDLPEPTPSPTPTSDPIACTPSPPPLYSLRVGLQNDQGWKKVLNSTPFVKDMDYCTAIGFVGFSFCRVRAEGDPQADSCSNRVLGQAEDTGRFGPTWYWNGKPCRPVFTDHDDPGCKNHEKNQFLAYAFGPGEYTVCGRGRVVCESLIIE